MSIPAQLPVVNAGPRAGYMQRPWNLYDPLQLRVWHRVWTKVEIGLETTWPGWR